MSAPGPDRGEGSPAASHVRTFRGPVAADALGPTLMHEHVFVRDLDLMALIGIYDHEKIDPQRIIVNIDLSVQEGDGPQGDDIGHVVSYEIVVKKVEQLIYISEYKRFQSAPGTRLSRRAFWLDRRYPIVNRWRDNS